MQPPLTTAVEHTLLYLDQFDFAPTLLEVEKWLLKNAQPTTSLSQIQTTLNENPRITHKEGFFMLTGREELATIRKKKYDATDEKWKHAQPFLKLLAAMPFIQAMWFSNSMGWHNARHESDIDLVIVTTPGRIWTARFFTTALMKLLRQRPHEQDESKAICLSFYSTAQNLDLEQYKISEQDIHFTFWATQLYPVYDPKQLFQEYQKTNDWLHNTFERLHWTQAIANRTINIGPVGRTCKSILQIVPLERPLRWLQLRIMPGQVKQMANKDNRVVVNDHILKFHTNDRRIEQQAAWEQLTQ